MADAIHTLRRAQPWLGTLVDIEAEGPSASLLDAAVAAAFEAIERVHRALSAHDGGSELSRINRSARHTRQPVSADFRAVLACALDVAQASVGAFDPTIGGHLAALGLLPQHGSTETDEENQERASWRDVDLDDRGVRYAKALRIDFGGIAKGYAVDCAVGALRARGVTRACVNAGGDLRIYGYEAMTIHVRTGGARKTLLPLIAVSEGAVATSAYGDQRQRINGRWATPLIDPAFRLPSMSTRTVSVIAPSCMLADALTKVLILRDRAAVRVLTHYHAEGAIFSPSGTNWRCTRVPSADQGAAVSTQAISPSVRSRLAMESALPG